MTIAFLVIAGLIALVLGGDLLVRGAERIALRLGVSPMLIGLTLVGFGTSTPELVTSIQAAFAGSPGVSIGNVVGSNIANILLILGISTLMSPIVVGHSFRQRDAAVLAGSALLCLGVVVMGSLERIIGVLLVIALVGYVLWSIASDRKATAEQASLPADPENTPTRSLPLNLVFVVAGLALTVLGANWLVKGAVQLASSLGVSETLIGLTIVAIGTSLPELITSVMAAIRKQGDMAFGNIVGSNIYNVLFILGATAVIHPIPIPEVIAQQDIWVMLAATAFLIAFAFTERRISRWEGGMLLTGYVMYSGLLIWQAVH